MSFRTFLLAVSSVSLLALSAATAAAQTPVGATPAAANATSPASAALKALYEGDWAWSMREFGQIPDGEGGIMEADYLPHVDAETQARRQAHWRQMLDQLNAISPDSLSDEDRIHAAVFRTILENALIDGRFREWEMPFNSDSNFWTYLDSRQGFRTAEAYRRYIARMRDIPRYFDEQTVNMQAGLKRGFSVPRATVEGRDQSIASFITADPEASAFYAPFRQMPSNMPAAEQAALRQEARDTIGQAVAPAYQRLLDFYRNDYLPQTRTTVSARDMPDGAAYYEAQILKYTTLDISADEVHRIGLQEVARIQADMVQIMRDSGFTGTFPEFLHFLRTDPQFYAKTPEELLAFSSWVAKRVDGKLEENFSLLPRKPFTIIPVPEALAPFYTAGRGGLDSCQMNTYNLASRPLYNIPALTLHECTPGHSFQGALASERDQGPAFRRYTYFSGYGEGWGLYTEWLGVEMGIYRNPYENFGRLSYEMWRAARLVIDTGIHNEGWSRQQAIDYLAEHTALSQHEVESEVDRYISWPGQALAYKLGEMTIRRARLKAETALGPRFDRRHFHDLILSLGSVPLPVLEARLDRFIDETLAEPAPAAEAQGSPGAD